MNKEWSETNKQFQKLISREETFADGIKLLLEFRGEMFAQITQIVSEVPPAAFSEQPFPKSKSNDGFTLAWSMWHLFRIEDIVCHELIARDQQILFAGNRQSKINSKIITTGNEMNGTEFVDFSRQLSIPALYDYCKAVFESSNKILQKLTWADTKKTFTEQDKSNLITNGYVSSHPEAIWLADYWCGKNVVGLLKMPFSRHWIMHIEGMIKIVKKIVLK